MMPNAAAHRRMIDLAGFDVVTATTYGEHFGVAHPERGSRGIRNRLRRLEDRLVAGAPDVVPHSAVLSRIAHLD
jgi:hypothetical protein